MVISHGTNDFSFCRAAASNRGSAKRRRVKRFTKLDSATPLLWISLLQWDFFFSRLLLLWREMYGVSKCLTGRQWRINRVLCTTRFSFKRKISLLDDHFYWIFIDDHEIYLSLDNVSAWYSSIRWQSVKVDSCRYDSIRVWCAHFNESCFLSKKRDVCETILITYDISYHNIRLSNDCLMYSGIGFSREKPSCKNTYRDAIEVSCIYSSCGRKAGLYRKDIIFHQIIGTCTEYFVKLARIYENSFTIIKAERNYKVV